MTDLPHQAILSQDHGSYKGYFAENLVAQELTAVGKTPLYCWQGRQSEVEFLAMEEDRVIPIEVKAGTCARSRSLAAYTQKFAPTRKVKVTARNLDLRGDIHNYPLYLADELWTLGLLRR